MGGNKNSHREKIKRINEGQMEGSNMSEIFQIARGLAQDTNQVNGNVKFEERPNKTKGGCL